ncbi:sugar kinase [Alteribacillus sp. HJP-4]|uniref:sugar kinase n=1 Tax=Alteribacillus sp. HJP-4 TaxID=2775394 RepID=UPI0035CCE9E8
MIDVLTIGDGMITMNPKTMGPLRFSNEFERKVGGAELNLAIGCARLGLKTSWISRLGNDEFGQYILNYMRGEGIDVSSVTLEDAYTTPVNFKEIMENGSGSTYYYRFPSPTETITLEDIHASAIKNTKVFYISGVFSSLAARNVKLLHEAVDTAKQHGAMIALDPNIRLKLWSRQEAQNALLSFLPKVDIVLSGEEEANILFGEQTADEHAASFTEYGIQRIAIKRGSQGALCTSHENKMVSLPAPMVDSVVDTVGAGDGFNSGFLYGTLQKWDLEKTTRFANQVGALVVGVSGDNEGLPYVEKVKQALGEMEKIER